MPKYRELSREYRILINIKRLSYRFGWIICRASRIQRWWRLTLTFRQSVLTLWVDLSETTSFFKTFLAIKLNACLMKYWCLFSSITYNILKMIKRLCYLRVQYLPRLLHFTQLRWWIQTIWQAFGKGHYNCIFSAFNSQMIERTRNSSNRLQLTCSKSQKL